MCANLASLDLGGNKLASLEDDIFSNLSSLTELDLSKNILTELPMSVRFLSKLVRLNLRQNRLTSIPSGLGSCASLAELYLGYNALETVPPEIAELQKLGSLELRANQLQDLPVELCNLQLSLLDLSDNSVGSLPSELGFMTTLRKLVLDGNPLRGVRSSLILGPTTQLLRHLRGRLPNSEAAGSQVLVSSGNVFGEEVQDSIAKSVTKASSTGVIELQGQSLTKVPPQAWEENNVVSLDLSKNAISALPPELERCTSLKILSLADNKLSEWPTSLWSSLISLQQLFMARNPINEFPQDAFSSLGKLKELDLTGVAAPLPASPSLSLMPSLERLHLRQTKLREIPSEICQLRQLRFLDLSENSIIAVPEVS
ncbi:hypothetical protein CBR_g29878 [Chara braunii]|uniref:Uncharacterized protein n=1 Tax=Chara braunii TaxID=69332 RepID=A0A388JWV6_CHABU|nr:hypothetical protein CBR_g29878 [Chara braunii]|eukprot:GBG62270.1 hypothetical protein CBR_g29878 [Chara braunii]